MAKRKSAKTVETLRHEDAARKNIPTAEYQAVMAEDDRNPIRVAYERRNRALDPQLVWRGKDEQNWSDLVIDDLRQRSKETGDGEADLQTDLFADFNGLPSADAQTEFYQHDANWSNRMILGDSLQVMASLAEREGLRGKVQCIYIDPPYGIKFNSNFQWSTTSRDVKDGNAGHITRAPEQVKAFRDTWRDGIHSADSRDGQIKEAALARKTPSEVPTYNDIRQGFVYERVPHITLKSIANNAEIDVIYEKFQQTLEPLRAELNDALGTSYEEWEIPRDAADAWPEEAKKIHADWWEQRIARQKEIDASIAAKADYEYLYDKPYEDNKKVRVAGPFTVESLSPHRLLGVDENDELIDNIAEAKLGYGEKQDFAAMILDNLKTSGVQQAHKEDHIAFSGISPWPGDLVCAEGTYVEGNGDSGVEKRAGIFVGPEFGTVSRPDLVSAGREAADADFDVLVACAFNYDAHASEFNKLGRVPVLKARMNADLHMADDLKNTGKGNLFVIFGEPDIDILDAADSQIQVKVNGVDVFHPNTGEIRSDSADGIACWFVDTDYNEESFFVRHAYFLGANDPDKSLRTTLKAKINQEA